MIGCGGMNSAHMEALSKIQEAKMVAFADVVEERARGCADKFSGRSA